MASSSSPLSSENNHPSRKKRILLVDDHAIVRDGLCEVIEREPDFEVCGQAGDALAALALAASTKPDLALIELMINGKNGLELIKDFRLQHPQVAVVALSMYDELIYAERVLRVGGRGYLMKKEGGSRLVEVIRLVLAGEIVVSPKVSAKFLHSFSGKNFYVPPIERLSDRELEILRLIGSGKENHTIAETLRLSPKTVETHRGAH